MKETQSSKLKLQLRGYGVSEDEHQIGAVTGLAWTEVGGELLTIESVTVPGGRWSGS